MISITILILTASLSRCDPIPPEWTEEENATTPCVPQPMGVDDVQILDRTHLLIKRYNLTIAMPVTEITAPDGTPLCLVRSDELKAKILGACRKWAIEADEYLRLPNGSLAYTGDGSLIEPGTYEFKEGTLWVCQIPYEGEPISGGGGLSQETFVKVGKTGSWVSIVALVLHLTVFAVVPTLRNMPGYHLAALSVAFLFGYSFSLIGQIPAVLGAECVASGMLQQYFFLAAFFCTNAMALDIWRTLRLATSKLAVTGEEARRRRFRYHMAWAWGAPAVIVAAGAIAQAYGPPNLRPGFGTDDLCWMHGTAPKAIFFYAPAFVLFVANAVLFVAAALTVRIHAMHDERNGRITFALYVRLALMTGLTWLLGVVALAVNVLWLWFIFDLLNSLQGVFIAVLFFGSGRVCRRIKERWQEATSSSTASSSNVSSSNTKQTTSGS